MKENEGLAHNYSMDMCPKTLDLISRNAYIAINPDWTAEEIKKTAEITNK